MATSPYGRGLMGLMKKGWNEIPAVMSTSVLAVIGIGIFGYLTYIERTVGIHPPKYKNTFMIVRPDDPRAKRPVNTYPD